MLLSSLLEHAASYHGGRAIVSRLASGDAHRTTYAELAARTRSLARALDQLGVAATDLENAAVADPDVAQAAVIGIPHPKWQESPLLLLRCCHQGRRPEMAEVLAFVAVKVPCWWQPDEVRIVGELPHTATGNLLKTRLRELYAGGVYDGEARPAAPLRPVGRRSHRAALAGPCHRLPTEDPLFGRGYVRADGRVIHDIHLFRAKTPAESRGHWNLYDYVSTVPGDAAFRPLADDGCKMVKS